MNGSPHVQLGGSIPPTKQGINKYQYFQTGPATQKVPKLQLNPQKGVNGQNTLAEHLRLDSALMKYHQNPDAYKMGEVGYIHWNKSPQPNVPRKPHHWQSITTQKQSSTGPSVY